MAASGRTVGVLKPSAEKTNYIRLARLLMCGGTTIVREVFDSIIPPSQLPTKLNEPAVVSKLHQMRNRKILTFPQWKVLFPSSGTYGKSESFDITLMFKLLREFCGLPAPPRGWDTLPDDRDHSLSADLARIKCYRRELIHVQDDLGISDGDFNTYWKRIKDALLRMVQTLPSLGSSKDWEDAIDKLHTGPITDDDERNNEKLKYWYIQDIEFKDMRQDKIVGGLGENMLRSKDFQADYGKPEPPRYGTILRTTCVLIDVEGGFHDLSSLGVLLQIPPNAVTHPTDITCFTFSPDLNCPPTEENETLVSYCVAFNSTSVPRLQKPMIVTLKHSGPSKKEGYETIVKAWKVPRTENHWKQMKEMREDTQLARELFQSRFIEVEISEWTYLAVVTRKQAQVELQSRPYDALPGSSDASWKDLEVCFADKSIATIDINEAASKVADLLKLDKISLDDPPGDIVVKCRELCSYLKSKGREDIVKQIRVLLPSGMTGPLGDGSILIKNIDFNSKQRISRALSAKEEWKAFAENVGVSKDDIAYYERERIPVLVILDKYCGDMTVQELYVHIVESGANAIADNYLDLMVDNTTPSEILARGPKARRAYQMALKSGKTKNLRVPVMLVGQSCAGKTSLLRSLKREKFDPKEDSTEGVKLHRFISKAEEEVWREGETTENSFYGSAAKATVENMTAQTSGQELSNQEDDDENLRNVDVPTVEKRNLGDFSDVTKEQSKWRAFELKSQEEQEKTPENVSENAVPEEVVERTTYMLQNLKTMENNESIHLMTMDFAGQPVYQATHPVFLSPKGIYILVHSLKNDAHKLATPIVRRGSLEPRKIDDNCPMTNMDHLEFWLSFVASNATTAEDKAKKEPQVQGLKLPLKFPPVFLVCTHADESFEKQNSEEISKRILAHLKREEKPSGQHLVHAIYPIDNTVSGSTEKEENGFVKKLREDIRATAELLPQMGEDIPIRWLKFEKELTDIEGKKYITLEEAKNIAHKCQVDLESDELNTLLNYLHDLKIIIYFEDTNMIIIDTQWLLEMFVKVITVQPFLEWKRECEACWKKLENEGVLERILVEHLWSDVADEQNTIDVLLTVMEKFSLLCRWKRLDGSEVFLVPAMLVNSVAGSFNKLLTDPQLPIPLVIRFTRAHLPLGIFPRMLVTIAELCNMKWPKSRLPKFFHNFCRFCDVGGKNGSFDLVVTSDLRTITVGVIPRNNNDVSHDWDLIVDFCQFIKESIYDTLNYMRTDCPWMKTMGFEFGIRCPICSKSPIPCNCHKTNACMHDTCTHFIPEKELPRCYNDPTNEITVINEESYSHWFPKTAKNPNEPEIRNLMEAWNLFDNTSLPQGDANQEVINIRVTEVSVRNADAERFAKKLSAHLKLDRVSVQDPPEETVKCCRIMCVYLKKERRVDIIKELRKVLPSGMTGPLTDENLLVGDMIGKLEDLTKSLCDNDTWRKLAEHFGIRHCHFGFHGKKDNPAESILVDVCRKRSLTVGDLYDVLCKCDANAFADEFL